MNEEELKKEGLRSMKEFEMAWTEFFKDKPEPKNDDEDKKQQEEFHYWHNYVRKQSDTGKTPAEMYREIYGKEPVNSVESKEPSRMMNFEWDEEYDETDFDDKLDDAQEEAVVFATEIFEDSWKKIKQEVEGASKREACKYSFILGFLDYMKMMDKKAELIEKEMKKMSKEDMEKFVNGFKKYGEKKEKGN